MLSRPCRDDRGFTLVELLVAITLLSIIGGTVITSVVISLQTTTQATERVEALARLEQVQERMSRYIRAADPIDAAAADSLTLTTYDQNRRRRFVYQVSGSSLQVTETRFADETSSTVVSAATTTLLDDLPTTDIFSYFTPDGSSWVGTDPLADIARVEIALAHPVSDGPPIQLTTSVFVRNSLN